MTGRDDLPPREAIFVDEHWRVCHAFDSELPGWMVVVPLRHVEALHDLTHDEMAALGPLVRSLSIALRELVGCEKTYVMQFAEAAEHKHVHFHVVPRMAGFTDEQRGPNVFEFLRSPHRVPDGEMDRLAFALRAELEKGSP